MNRSLFDSSRSSAESARIAIPSENRSIGNQLLKHANTVSTWEMLDCAVKICETRRKSVQFPASEEK